MEDGLTPISDLMNGKGEIPTPDNEPQEIFPRRIPTRENIVATNESEPVRINVSTTSDSNEMRKNFFVKMPHSNFEFDVRGLTIEEEDSIKSSNSSAKRIADSIMHILYNCISQDIKKPGSPLGTYDSFIHNISLADRDALALAVIQQTYGASHEMATPCRRCGKSFTEEVSLPECMDLNIYTGEIPILSQRKVLEFPEFGWKMYLKIPTVADELATLSSNDRIDDVQKAAEFIYIDKIEFTEKNDQGRSYSDSFTNYLAIYGMLKRKPAKLRKEIQKAYEQFRGDWGVTGKHETTCKFCGSPVEVMISPISHLLFLVQ